MAISDKQLLNGWELYRKIGFDSTSSDKIFNCNEIASALSSNAFHISEDLDPNAIPNNSQIHKKLQLKYGSDIQAAYNGSYRYYVLYNTHWDGEQNTLDYYYSSSSTPNIIGGTLSSGTYGVYMDSDGYFLNVDGEITGIGYYQPPEVEYDDYEWFATVVSDINAGIRESWINDLMPDSNIWNILYIKDQIYYVDEDCTNVFTGLAIKYPESGDDQNFLIGYVISNGNFTETLYDYITEPDFSFNYNGNAVSEITLSNYESTSINVTVNVQSFVTWKINDKSDWITHNGVAEFIGSGEITLNIAKNTSTSERSGYITVCDILNGEFEYFHTLTIIQPGSPEPEPDPYINVTPSSLTFEAEGGSKQVTIDTNIEGLSLWNITTNQFWISVTELNGNILTITVEENITAYDRSGNVNISKNGVEANITITQTQTTPEIPQDVTFKDYNQELPYEAGSHIYTISANESVAWMVTLTIIDDTQSDWIRIDGNASGTGDGSITVNVDENGGDDRSFQLTVTNTNYPDINNSISCVQKGNSGGGESWYSDVLNLYVVEEANIAQDIVEAYNNAGNPQDANEVLYVGKDDEKIYTEDKKLFTGLTISAVEGIRLHYHRYVDGEEYEDDSNRDIYTEDPIVQYAYENGTIIATPSVTIGSSSTTIVINVSTQEGVLWQVTYSNGLTVSNSGNELTIQVPENTSPNEKIYEVVTTPLLNENPTGNSITYTITQNGVHVTYDCIVSLSNVTLRLTYDGQDIIAPCDLVVTLDLIDKDTNEPFTIKSTILENFNLVIIDIGEVSNFTVVNGSIDPYSYSSEMITYNFTFQNNN